jgi:hypothetical protein
MNSTVQAKMHYNGKQHEKKVKMFMAAWAQQHGEPVPKKAKLAETPEIETKQAKVKKQYYSYCIDF